MTKSQTEIWGAYVRLIAGDDVTQADIAERADVHQTTAGTWKKGEKLPHHANASLFAKSFGRNEVEAFVAAGMLSDLDLLDPILSDDSLEVLSVIGARGAKAALKRRRAHRDQMG